MKFGNSRYNSLIVADMSRFVSLAQLGDYGDCTKFPAIVFQNSGLINK